MKLSIKEVEHLAKLARLELSKNEKDKFGEQISSILDYFKELNEVDTTKVEPTFQVTGLKDVRREDKVKGCSKETRDELLNQAPDVKDDLIKVKAVFE